VIDEPGILRGDEFVSSHDLDVRSKRAASALASLGVTRGDSVALLMRNDIPFFEAMAGANILGVSAAPVNWHLKPEEVADIVLDARAKVLVGHADLVRPLLDLLPPHVAVRVVPTPADIGDAYRIPSDQREVPEGATEWNGWIAGFEPRTDPPEPAPSAMLYTSGTTGKPKGVRRDPVTRPTRYHTELAKFCGFRPGVRAVVTGPMYHGAPLNWANGWVRSKGFVVLAPKFDPEGLLATIEKYRITHLMLVPIMFNRLLQLPEEVRNRYDVSSLQHVTQGAAPCPRHVKRAMIDWWGPVFYEMYGSLEIGLVTGADSAEWLAHEGTVGKPLPGVELRILDDEGNEVPPGVPGEIYTRIAEQPDFEYTNNPEDRRRIERDGFLTAGDVGYVDEDGFLYLNDRKKDMIISGGVNIYPPQIEECLLTMPGVRDVAVFGIPDDEYGESVAAAVELDGTTPVTADEVRAYVRARMASYNAPKVVEFREIPRLESGKILKRQLREPYWRGVGRTI